MAKRKREDDLEEKGNKFSKSDDQSLSNISNENNNSSNDENNCPKSVMLQAITEENQQEIISLISKYPNLLSEFYGEFNERFSIILHAACKNKLKAIEALIQGGADPKATTDIGYNALHIAAARGHKEIVKYFLKNEIISVDDKDVIDGYTPLLTAADNNQLEIIDLLLEYGADRKATLKDGLNALHHAAVRGHKETVEYFLKNKIISVDDKDITKGFTPLLTAAYNNQLEIIELLIKYDADPKATSKDGLNALHHAAVRGHKETVEYFLKNEIISVDDKDIIDGYTPLLTAAYNNQLEIIELLIKYDADPKATTNDGYNALNLAATWGGDETIEYFLKNEIISVDDKDIIDGYTPLLTAADNNQLETIELLLEYGADSKATLKNGLNALHLAAVRGHEETIEYFLKNEIISVDDKDITKGYTPLIYAADNNQLEIIELLIKYDADPKATSKDGLNALHLAASWGHKEIIEYFLKNEIISVDDKNLINGFTPLLIAACNNQPETIELLIKYDADLKATSNKGHNALSLAAMGGSKETVEYFLKNEIISVDDKNLIDNHSTPLLTAAYKNQLETIELLLKYGADSKATLKNGLNALHLAASWGHKETVEYFLKNEIISVDDKNLINGYTPLIYAANNNKLEIIELLIKYDADPKATSNKGLNALSLAAMGGSKETVEYFLKNEIISVDDKNLIDNHSTPLLTAAYKNQLETIELLLKYGADSKATLKNGLNALHLAASWGHKETVEYFLKNEIISVDDKNLINGYTPLIYAANNKLEIIELLIKYDADPKATSNKGLNALHLAASWGHKETVEYFLKNKIISVDDKDIINGFTPLLIAACNNQSEIVKLLLKYGADPKAALADGSDSLHIAATRGHKEIVKLIILSCLNVKTIHKYKDDINNLITISEDINKIAQNEAFDSKCKYNDEATLKFASELFIRIYSKGNILFYDYSDITKRIDSHLFLNKPEHLALKNSLKDHLTACTKDTVKFLIVTEDEIIDKSQLFTGKKSQLAIVNNRFDEVDLNQLIESLTEIFSEKEYNIYSLVKQLIKNDIKTKLLNVDDLPEQYIAVEALKQNILSLKNYFLPTSKLCSAYNNILKNYQEISEDSRSLQLLSLEINNEEQECEIDRLEKENIEQNFKIEKLEEENKKMTEKMSNFEEFLKTLGYNSNSDAQTSSNLPNNLMQTDPDTLILGDSLCPSKMDEID